MAETASLFSEMLLAEYLLKNLNPEEKKYYFDEFLRTIFGNIMSTIMYTRFEKAVHESFYAGKDLSYRDLNILWRNEQVRLHGGQVLYDVSPEEETGWSMVPHIFHTPFYCYGYAFGFIMVFALYKRVKNGSLSRDDYKNILRAGGSERPRDLLGRYGIDIASPDFYRDGLAEVERMVEEFEQLI